METNTTNENLTTNVYKIERKTLIPFTVRNSNCIIKCTYEASSVQVKEESYRDNLTPIKQEVVAIGSSVKDLNLGEEVVVNMSRVYRLPFTWNTTSFKDYIDEIIKEPSDNKLLATEDITLIFEEYYICDQFDIYGSHVNNK